MKTNFKKNQVRLYAGFSIITCLVIGCFVAHGQGIQIQKIEDKTSIVIGYDPESGTLVEVLVSENLKDWRVEKVFLGSDGQIQWADSDSKDVSRRYYKFAQTPLNEASEMDADGDDFGDVFELQHAGAGMDPMVPNPVAVASVSTAKSVIVAGALESEPRQTEVTLQVSPAGSFPVKVWLEGGDGFGKESTMHFTGNRVEQYGPAKIAYDNQVCVAGGELPSADAIEVITDSDGYATLGLTSSNEIGEACIVHARAGTVSNAASQAHSSPVLFEQGILQFDLPQPLTGGQVSRAIIKRTDNDGRPLVDHPIVIFVNRVVINGIEYVFDPANPDNLSGYATVLGDGLAQKKTDENGKATFDLLIADTEGLDFLEMKAQDLQVFFGE